MQCVRISDVHAGNDRNLLGGAVRDPGAGSCSYYNPDSHQHDCVQYTGSSWVTAPDSAIAHCANGPIPDAENPKFAAGQLCAGYSDRHFGGECVMKAGQGDETRTVMVSGPFPLVICPLLKMACTTYAHGTFETSGGACKSTVAT